MLIAAQERETYHYPSSADQMDRLRARVFSNRRGRRVKVDDGQGRDHFDELRPLFICLIDNAHLLASLRLLSTTGPQMLADVSPEVMGDSGTVRHPLIWENSRLCVDTKSARIFSADGINVVMRAILMGLFSTAREIGLLNISSVYDGFVERNLRRADCISDRLVSVVTNEDLKTVGGLFAVSDTVVHQHASAKSRWARLSMTS